MAAEITTPIHMPLLWLLLSLLLMMLYPQTTCSCLPYPPDAVGHDPGTEPQQWRRAQSSKRTEPQRPSSGNIPQRYTNGCLPTLSPLLDNNYYHYHYYHYYLLLPLPASPCRAHTYDSVFSLRPGEDYPGRAQCSLSESECGLPGSLLLVGVLITIGVITRVITRVV